MEKDLLLAIHEALGHNHVATRLPLGGTGCERHPVCESCPFPDCIAREAEILRYDRRLEQRRATAKKRGA